MTRTRKSNFFKYMEGRGARPVEKCTDLVELKLNTMPFTNFFSTPEPWIHKSATHPPLYFYYSFVIGYLTDRFNKKRVLIFTTAFGGCASLAFGFTTTVRYAVLIRILQGFPGMWRKILVHFSLIYTTWLGFPEEIPKNY